MRDLELLETELECWADAGRVATFWWRDDDAVDGSPELDLLLQCSADVTVPVALAVIPALAKRALASCIDTCPQVSVLQHGYAHRNHASAGEKSVEFGSHRPLPQMIRELVHGREELTALIPDALPVLVPPWNRIDNQLLGELPRAGFSGLSAFTARHELEPAPGLRQINCHVDPIDWRGSRGFVGRLAAYEAVATHLRARRHACVDSEEPTGILTHHLEHDNGCWEFIRELLQCTHAHPAVRWLDAARLWGDRNEKQ